MRNGRIWTYTIRNLLRVPPMLLAITVIVFMTIRFIPESAIDQMIAEMTYVQSVEETRTHIRHRLGLDQPIHIHYLRWVGLMKQEDGRYSGLLQGNLGQSLWRTDE